MLAEKQKGRLLAAPGVFLLCELCALLSVTSVFSLFLRFAHAKGSASCQAWPGIC